jgi:hypothetical protein
MVYRLITKSTFEERINEIIHNKEELANLTVGIGENWVGNLSTKELISKNKLNQDVCIASPPYIFLKPENKSVWE